MREKVISVTQAARKFADCVNRVRYQGASFILHKNGVPVARIVPVESRPGDQIEPLGGALRDERAEVLLDETEAAAMFPGREEPLKNPQPPNPPKRPVLNW